MPVAATDGTCQTRTMRPLGTLVDILTWRVGIARTGVRLRLRSLFSFALVFGGIGAAIGYGVVARLGRGGPDDEADIQPVAE